MAVQIAGTASIGANPSGRRIFRNSSGIPYVLFTNGAIYKGNSTTPTSFSLAGSAKTSGSLATGCLLSGTTIGVLYRFLSGMTDEWRYDTFSMSTDSYAGSDETVASITASPQSPGIVADSNGVPHVTYNDQQSNMGTSYNTVIYQNRVGGSWNTAVEIEGKSAQKQCYGQSICIDPTNNAPFISYLNSTDTTLTKVTTTVNNPSGANFTFTDLDTSAATGQTSIAKDSNGDLYIAYERASNAIYLWDDASTTARSAGITGFFTSNHISIAPVGTDIHVITCDNDANPRVVYNKFDGTNWDGATILQSPSGGGTLSMSSFKWQNEFNYGSDGTNYPDSSGSIPELDYIWYANDSAVGSYFETISLSSPAVFIAPKPRVITQAIRGSEM